MIVLLVATILLMLDGGRPTTTHSLFDGLYPFGRPEAAAEQTVFTFTASSNVDSGDIDTMTVIDSHLLPAGNYTIDFSVAIYNPTNAAGAGSQHAMTGATDDVVINVDDTQACDHTIGGSSNGQFLSDMFSAGTDAALAGNSGLSMPVDAPVHTVNTCTSTAAIVTNPTTQVVTWRCSTNSGGCAVQAGSRIILTKQTGGVGGPLPP